MVFFLRKAAFLFLLNSTRKGLALVSIRLPWLSDVDRLILSTVQTLLGTLAISVGQSRNSARKKRKVMKRVTRKRTLT